MRTGLLLLIIFGALLAGCTEQQLQSATEPSATDSVASGEASVAPAANTPLSRTVETPTTDPREELNKASNDLIGDLTQVRDGVRDLYESID